MKQILQSLKSGATEVADVPCPVAGSGQLLVATSRSLVSAGTERMLVDFGRAGLIGKARQQPEKVRQVIDKVRTDGLAPTLEAVFGKLDQPLPLGYCNVGIVLELGLGVAGFAVGDRVVSNGRHAEVVAVPGRLAAAVPDCVGDDEAAFAVLGAVALHGVRLAQPTLGEAVVVTGLGLVGLLAVQLLRAHGCRVLGLDFDRDRLELAERFGAETLDLSTGEDPVSRAQAFSRGRGVDAVLIAAATQSNDPVRQAARMSRKRGRIVLTGVAGLDLSRADFYEKELSFQVSCSYGPGRYDPDFEDRGQDYPVGFVRWTAQRNFEAVLDMLADGRLDVKPLISHRFAVADAARAYALVGGAEPSLGILLDYPRASEVSRLRHRSVPVEVPRQGEGRRGAVAFIGAGSYATGVLIPAFKAAGAQLVEVVSQAGVSGLHAARKFGFASASTDLDAALANPAVNAVAIATRHDSHADLVCRALDAGKHVFVEKPLALTAADLDRIAARREAALERGGAPLVMVGFNRRFAPHSVTMRALLAARAEPKAFVMSVNAGAIPAAHWTQDASTGGGRIAGEACHFIDLLRFLAGAEIVDHTVRAAKTASGDTATITLAFADGSIGTIHYFANGSKKVPKERLEVFCGGAILSLDNFRVLAGHGWKKFSSQRLWRQDKGQRACAAAFLGAIERGGPAPIPFGELLEVSRVTLAVAETARA